MIGNFKCCIDNCATPAECYCECSEKISYICPNHLFQHIKEKDTIKHYIQAIFLKVDPEEKSSKLEFYEKMLESIKDTECSIHFELSNLISKINSLQTQYIKFFREQRLIYQNFIENFKKEAKKIGIPGYEDQNLILISYNDYISDFNLEIKKVCQEMMQIFSKARTHITTYKEFYDENKLDYDGLASLDKDLYFLYYNAQILCKLDDINLNYQSFNIKSSFNMPNNASLCQIPGKKLFVSGGSSPYSSQTFIIDIQKLTIENLPESICRGDTLPTYYNNCVYIFGGCNNTGILNYVEKFDLVNKAWISLGKLPGNAFNVKTVTFRSYFLMTFYGNSSMLKYKIKENSYEFIWQLSFCYSILFRIFKTIYLIEGYKIFTSNEENPYAWVLLKSFTPYYTYVTISKPLVKNRNIFFVTNDRNIWRLNIDSLDQYMISRF